MNLDLLNPDVISKIILNTIFVSIPEEIFLVLFTLILMGEFNYWMEDECKKLFYSWDYGRILIPSIVTALISNILRYGGINSNLCTTLTMFTLYLLIIITNDIFNDASIGKWMGKAVISIFLAFIVLFIAEILYVPLLLSATSLSIEQINGSVLFNTLASLPSRILQFLVLAYLIAKKRTLLKTNIIIYIFSSKILTVQTLLIMSFNISFMILSNKLLVFDNFLMNTPDSIKILIIVFICILPLLTTSALILNPYYIENKQIAMKKKASDELHQLSREIANYNNKNSKDTTWMLNKLTLDIEDIANNLYKDSK